MDETPTAGLNNPENWVPTNSSLVHHIFEFPVKSPEDFPVEIAIFQRCPQAPHMQGVDPNPTGRQPSHKLP